jgi:hypothetical protein
LLVRAYIQRARDGFLAVRHPVSLRAVASASWSAKPTWESHTHRTMGQPYATCSSSRSTKCSRSGRAKITSP